jgi:hypothetical protein
MNAVKPVLSAKLWLLKRKDTMFMDGSLSHGSFSGATIRFSKSLLRES